ncbi:MAG: hypothetical protein CMO55_03745 [Verrucomicrobiales bacterium]|nr:hypothetical protein [Verrucomicrobiales bacterium]
METLFRWSKYVEEDRLEEWESRLIMADITYSAEKQVNRKRWQLSTYTTTRDEADELRARFGGGVTEMRPGDWQPSAEAGAESRLKIRDSLLVTEAGDDAVWESLKVEFPDRIVMSFPPQMAFGTGGHPTTAGCLRFLADTAATRKGKPWRVLDLGCGSGILAIAAALLGAAEVYAVEIDEMALSYAVRNAERHGVADKISFSTDDAIEVLDEQRFGAFDVIAANLFSELLMRILPSCQGSLNSGGEVIVSGFLTSQAGDVSRCAEESGLPFDDYLRRGKWVAAMARTEKKD